MTATDHALTPIDTAWLHMDDPTNLMMVTAVFEFDGPVDFDRLKRTWGTRLTSFERFRQRVTESVVPLKAPHWEDDPNFDFDSHIHRLSLPAPRSKRTLLAIIGDLASTPLDATKPLWQVHVIENYRGGSVLVMRHHHCIADGTAMVAVVDRLMDSEANAPMESPATEADEEGGHRGLFAHWNHTARSVLATTRKAAGMLVHEAVESLLHPSHLFELGESARHSAEIVGHALTMPADPKTPFKGPLGAQKHVAWSAPVQLDDVKRICKRTGAKVNDVLLTAMTGALRHYLIREQFPVDDLEIRAVVPVDLRPPGKALDLGNDFGLVFLPLPIGISDPLARMKAIKAHMDEIKRSPEPYVFFSLLSLFGAAPRQVEEQAVKLFGTKATTVMTNVAGPREQLYMAGAPIRNMMFWVPQSGRLGLGVSILSYNGKVTLGVVTDAGLVPEPARITRRFRHEFEQLATVAAI